MCLPGTEIAITVFTCTTEPEVRTWLIKNRIGLWMSTVPQFC
jgi:hypothetical protein